MRLPVNEYDKWYIATQFGEKVDYGYHEAVDLNLKTGGDTDLGQPLYAIADGEVTSVHNHTAIPTFGNHVHIKHDGPWGTVYSHYAHCFSIAVKVGDKVSEGQEIAKVGKSGTTAAHSHFAIKLQPTGIDAVAHTKEELKKWTDPIAFINKYQGVSMNMYKGYDLDNAESMKVCVDTQVRLVNGEFVDKPKYEADKKTAYDLGYKEGQANAPVNNNDPNPDPSKYELNGLNVTKGDYSYNYKIKEA